jgi:hypothetical protein
VHRGLIPPRSSRTTPPRSAIDAVGFLKPSMSAMSCSARSIFDVPLFTCVPVELLDPLPGSNTPVMGLIASRYGLISLRSRLSSTPAWAAASYASSGKISQPPNTMSSRSSERHEVFDLRVAVLGALAERMVASWVSEPIGCARPRRTASTPAMKVVATAPMPGSRMPSFICNYSFRPSCSCMM